MKICILFSLFLISIEDPLIFKNKFRLTNDEKEEYILSNFSNFNCNISNNYTTSFIAKTCSSSTINKNQIFFLTFKDTNSNNHKIKCTINSNSKLRYLQEYNKEQTDIEDEEVIIPNNYCYQTICEFDGMIKKNFTFLINSDFTNNIEGLPDNINLNINFDNNQTFNVDKCYLVKNIFKQVSKYRKYNDEKMITLLFISSIKAKVEKDEELSVDVILQKNGSYENRNIICYSLYEAKLIEGQKEILAFYECQIPNIKNINEYIGLNFSYSPDIQNIPINSDLNNPKATDELIKDNKVKDYSIIKFISKSVDFSDCEKNGTLRIKGNIKGYFSGMEEFGFIFYLNDSDSDIITSICKIPSGYLEELTITCVVDDDFKNSKIYIPDIAIMDSETNDTLLEISHISVKKYSTCIINPIIETTEIIKTTTIPTIIPTTIKIEETTYIEIEPIIIPNIVNDVVFRQINNLKIDSDSNNIKFNIIGFVNNKEPEMNMVLPINVNLVNSDDNQENKDLNCSLNNIINSTTEKVYSLIFNCSIKNIENDINNYKDVQIINSSSLINVPKQDSNLSSALLTDQSIGQGLLIDFYKDNNIIEILPIISSTSIKGDRCSEQGIFDIDGFNDKSIDTNLSFYLDLENQNTKVRCKMLQTDANSKVNINCYTFDEFNYEYILISSKIVYDINLNELFYLNGVNSTEGIYCSNNDKIKFEEAQKKMESFVCFRQVSKFNKKGNKYEFFLASFIKRQIALNEKIHFLVEIKSSSSEEQIVKFINKEKIHNSRKLSRREEQAVECSINSQTPINDNGLGAAGWNCSTGESSISDADGLEIKESDDVSGIPEDPALIDPALTDNLIENGELTDYSIEENLNILLPLFNTLELNYSFCKQNGTFSLIGNVSSTIENDVVFNLTLSYPDTIFACKLPRVLKGEIAEIECYSKEEFVDSSILIEETVIRYDNKEYFILRNTSSGDRYVTCSYSNLTIDSNLYDEGFSVVSRRIRNNNKSGGLGATGIIIISVFGAIILAGIIALIVLIKNKKVDKNKEQSTVNKTIGNSSSSYY